MTTQSPSMASQATAELPSEERERILKAAALAMPFANPLIWQDWWEGHTVHTEADDIVAIWQAAEAAGRASRAQETDVLREALGRALNVLDATGARDEAEAARAALAQPLPATLGEAK